MNTSLHSLRLFAGIALCVAMAALGCNSEEPPLPPAKKVPVSPNVTVEVQGEHRRVFINAAVCRREGFLEVMLTHKVREKNKSHESILWADVDARKVHEALLYAGAKEGSPIRYEPELRAPRGQAIKVTLQYEADGKQHTVPAQSWVRNGEGKELSLEWVFAGSQFRDNPLDVKRPKTFMAQEEGTLITLSNFESALIDVGAFSSKDKAEVDFECFTERIPPLDTKVTVILEPVK